MTVDELKTLPRFHFIIAKTGAHPMKTKLDLFMKWGISLDKKFEVDKNNVREVHYAGKDQLIAEIEKLGTGLSSYAPIPKRLYTFFPL